jgi:hypothetical protein
MKTITRFAIASVLSAAALCFYAPASHAFGNAPWCAVVDTGAGRVTWECQYRTFEECVPNVLAGNRGFCNMNPGWPGWDAPKTTELRKPRKRR